MLKRLSITLIVSVPTIFLCCGFLDTTTGLNQKGNKSYNEKHYETALEAYRKAQIKSPDTPEVRYNLGTTLYQLDQFQEAETQLQQALANSKTNDLKATAWYNFGNTQYRLGNFDKATEAYKETLKLNPKDKDAKYNLEVLQKKKSLFENKQNQRDQQKKENPPPSQQQKQQQQQGGGQSQQQQQSQSQSQQNQQQKPQKNEGDQESQQDQEEGDEQQKPKDEKGQDEKSKSSERDQQKEQKSKEDQKQDEQKQNEGQEPKNEPQTPADFQPGEEEGPKPEAGQGQEQKPLLQGQMSQENALRILNALKESEQELQVLRRPHRQSEHEPLKDW